MRDIDQLKSELRAMLPELKKRYPISYLGVFGSYVRGEQREDSDVDLLVEFDRRVGLDFVRLKLEIADRLGVHVDLVERPALEPRRRLIDRHVLGELQPV